MLLLVLLLVVVPPPVFVRVLWVLRRNARTAHPPLAAAAVAEVRDEHAGDCSEI